VRALGHVEVGGVDGFESDVVLGSKREGSRLVARGPGPGSGRRFGGGVEVRVLVEEGRKLHFLAHGK